MFLTLLSIIVAALAAYFLYKKFGSKSESTEPVEETIENSTPIKEREEKLLELTRQARLEGISHVTNFDTLIDHCVEIHHLLSNSERADIEKMQSVPKDFQRLLDEHLMNFINKFSLVSGDKTETIKKFNETIEQLVGELNKTKEDIQQRNFADFDRQARFMNIRFSDKY